MPAAGCPITDDELLAVSLGEVPSPQLQSHLQECGACQSRLQQLQQEVTTLWQSLRALPASPAGTVRTPAEMPGTISQYCVVGKLGQDTQATLYRAFHPLRNSEVAIKLRHEPVGSDQERDWLIGQARLLVNLQHPHVMRVWDLGFEGGRPFLVLDFLKGTKLDKWVSKRPLEPAQAARMVAQLARACGALRQQGLGPQDLRPEKILIDSQGQPKITDFDLGLPQDSPSEKTVPCLNSAATENHPDQSGEGAGKPSPTEVRALGGLLYFLLSGKQLGPGEWVTDGSKGQGEFVGSSALVGVAVPRPLRSICLRALALAPKPFGHADELAAALEEYLRRPQHRRRLLALVCLVGLLCFGGWLILPFLPSPFPSPTLGKLTAQVARQGQPYVDVDQALPLRHGDFLAFSVPVPAGKQAALFVMDATGQFRELDTEVADGQLRCPPKGEVFRLGEVAGTEFFLVCARAEAKPRREDLVVLLEPGPWPLLPKGTLVHLSPDKVTVQEIRKGQDVAAETNLSRVENALQVLRQKLNGRYDSFVGIALPHYPPE